MTDLHLALSAAGVQLPTQMQRIWVWLKDHQPQAARRISFELHIPQASTLLSQMERRRMVTCTKDLDRSTGMITRRYSTVGRVYELLPPPKKVKPQRVAPAAPVQAAPAKPTTGWDRYRAAQGLEMIEMIEPCPVPAPTQAESIKAFNQAMCRPAPFDLDALTIAEARALYTRLARMFKGETA